MGSLHSENNSALITKSDQQEFQISEINTTLLSLSEKYKNVLSKAPNTSNYSTSQLTDQFKAIPNLELSTPLSEKMEVVALDTGSKVISTQRSPAKKENKLDDRNASTTTFSPIKTIKTNAPQFIAPPISRFSNSTLNRGLILTNNEKESTLKFRIGYQFRSLTTFTESEGKFNFGFSNGLKSELIFNSKIGITAGVNFNQQRYKIYNNGSPIPTSELLKYPNGSSFGNRVTLLLTKSKYLDLPLGVKWKLKSLPNDGQIYLNPSVVWQMYFPQKFIFELDDNSDVSVKNRQFFGYFGSANIQLGYELPIGNKLIWQFGAWGERSFIPLGIEDQRITMVGFNTAILFQN